MKKTLLAIAVVVTTCLNGVAHAAASEIRDPSEMLFVYDREADAGRFDEALRHAVAGCERLRILYCAGEVADLPLQMAGQGINVPPKYGAEQKRIADAICLSGKRMVNGDGLNATGFICGYYAQQFARAHSTVRQGTFLTRAWQYLDSIHDPVYAGRLYQVACKHGKADACKRIVAQAGEMPAQRQK